MEQIRGHQRVRDVLVRAAREILAEPWVDNDSPEWRGSIWRLGYERHPLKRNTIAGWISAP